jgi:hypothetical protein
MVGCNILGTGALLQVPQDNTNPAGKGLVSWVDHVVLNYDTFFLIIMYYIYIVSTCHMIFKLIILPDLTACDL